MTKSNLFFAAAFNFVVYMYISVVRKGYEIEFYYSNAALQAEKETIMYPNRYHNANTTTSSLLFSKKGTSAPLHQHLDARQNSKLTKSYVLPSTEGIGAPQQLHSEARQQRALDVTTKSDTQVEAIMENKKPTIILHVGPMKTGTTYLQLKIFENRRMREAFKQDNIEFTVKNNAFGWRPFCKLIDQCLIFGDECPNDSKLKQLLDFYDNAYTPDPSLTFIHSVENYSSIPDNNFTISLFRKLQEKWNVKVVLFHRRPADWFFSLYKQVRKGQMYWTGSNKFKDYSSPATTFDEFMDSAPTRRDMDSLRTAELFRKMFGYENVQILDYHVPNLAVEFLCNGLNAPASCAKVSSLKVSFLNNNNQFLYDEDLLVMEAYNQGLLNSFSIPRHEATLKLHDYFVRERMNIPYRCASQTKIDWIWNRTLYTEYNLAPSPTSNETMLREQFESSATKKFCDIDAIAMLKNVTWRNLLSSCDFLKSEFAGNCAKTFQLLAQ